jgi:hypothetical protein
MNHSAVDLVVVDHDLNTAVRRKKASLVVVVDDDDDALVMFRYL